MPRNMRISQVPHCTQPHAFALVRPLKGVKKISDLRARTQDLELMVEKLKFQSSHHLFQIRCEYISLAKYS